MILITPIPKEANNVNPRLRDFALELLRHIDKQLYALPINCDYCFLKSIQFFSCYVKLSFLLSSVLVWNKFFITSV